MDDQTNIQSPDPIMNRSTCVTCGREMRPQAILAGTYFRIVDRDQTVNILDEVDDRLCFRYRMHLVCAECLQVGITTLSAVSGVNEMMREVWGIGGGEVDAVAEEILAGRDKATKTREKQT